MQTYSQSFFQFLDLPITQKINHAQPIEGIKQEIQEFIPRRVSQKLFQNKIRKMQIDEQKRKQKETLMQKRRNKEKSIFQFIQRRGIKVQEQRETYLKYNSIRNNMIAKNNQLQAESLNKFHTNDDLIKRCRQKVQQKKQEYVTRIHNKTCQKQEKALQRRRILHENLDRINDEINLEQWRSYETKLLQKHKNDHSPPDRLYQQYKKKRQNLDSILNSKQKQNINTTTIPHKRQTAPQTFKTSSSKNIIFRSRKIQYFGVHQQDIIKKTQKDIIKMRKFIDQNPYAFDPSKEQELIEKFQSFLLNEILKN